MPAARSLDSLPFDIFYEIATSLDGRDFINLSRTNRALYALAQSDLVARKIVEKILLFSKEGQSALHQTDHTYRKAVGHRFDIHEAVATAAPYSVSFLAYGTDFLYNQGILCYRVGHNIRLLDVHVGGKQERVLNLKILFRRLDSELLGADAVDRVSLLRYVDKILVFRVDTDDDQDDLLLAIDMTTSLLDPRKGRLLLKKKIPAGARVFVRHSRTYIWYGLFTAVGGGSDGGWTVYGVDLTSNNPDPIKPTYIQTGEGDLGQSICFEIYNEHLYAVSTQVTSDEDERYSSFYHWFCYAPRHNHRKWSGRIWRREHCEGPINELWTDLSIYTDEATGRPVILECRREYADGKSENHRTYYTTPLRTPEQYLAMHGEGNRTLSQPLDDLNDLSEPLECEESNRYHNAHRPNSRLRRDYHAEYESTHDPTRRKEFIMARTQHRSYNLAASTFIDLVNDPVLQSDSFRSQACLHLRTVSRKRKCPIDEEGTGLLHKPTQYSEDGIPVEGSEERFVARGVYMWPPDDAPAELRHLLCPDSRINNVRAISDDRSLIYSIRCAGLPAGNQALILISFDPQIHFPMLSSLRTMKAPVPDKPFPIVPDEVSSTSLVREDKPLYEAINWGYWLR